MTISTCYDCSERVDRESMHLIKASTLSGRALICDRCHIAEVDRVTAVNLSIQAKLKRARKAAEERYGDRGETPLTADAVRNARTDAFIAGYLWRAAQQPTREQIAEVLWNRANRWEPGMLPFNDISSVECEYWMKDADAVLALFDGAGS